MSNQWVRKVLLIVHGTTSDKGLDLSAFRIKFNVLNADFETPNNAAIRIYNIDSATIRKMTSAGSGEFSLVTLNAGYENGSFGIIFTGTIKQYRIGKENNKETFLDILAADGDIPYNQGVVNQTLAKGTTPQNIVKTLVSSMPGTPALNDDAFTSGAITSPSIRGVVLVGMIKARLRNQLSSLDASWSIQNGTVVAISNTGYAYKDEEVPVINSATGMIGVPEQTQEGIKVTCLLNSLLRIGGRVKLNNEDIIQTLSSKENTLNVAFNSLANFTFYVPTGGDGVYRCYVVEHEGDTRGQAWYTHLVCLAVNPSNPTAPVQNS